MWWYVSVIPAVPEAEVEGLQVQAQSVHLSETLPQNKILKVLRLQLNGQAFA